MTTAQVRVLVIEDNRSDRVWVEHLLRSVTDTHFEIQHAGTLQDGLDVIDRGGIDVVLLDLTLPDSEGLESCRQVDRRDAALPIVVLTGLDDQEVAITSLHHGAQDYLVKGQVDENLLSRSLRYAIERKRDQRQLQKAHDELELRVEQRTAELRQMQEAARLQQEELAHVSRLNTLGEMASGLAHELNQPLMAIIGFTDVCLQLMRSEPRDERQIIEIMEDTSSEARRAGEIIKRLRKLVSRRPTQQTSIDLNELVEDTIPLLGRRTAAEVRLELAEGLPAVVADRIQIQQVLLNLIQNALQAMDAAGSPTRELTVRTGVDAAGQTIHAEVADTGPGLPPGDLERLFEPFFSRKPEGLGLGLSISRSIIESHAGQMTVRQNPGDGLTFRFTLPLARLAGES